MKPAGPNAEQIRYWNDEAGAKWAALQPRIDAQIGPLGRQAMDRASIQLGDRVLDVGCGCGHTTLELAERVGPNGSVMGVDLSAPMLERARAAAASTGVNRVRFENADAQTHVFEPEAFEAIFSRFGVMFFAHPEEAFKNLHAALRPGGRLAFVCWRALKENPWMFVPLSAALQHLPPPPPSEPGAPGPFAFADADRVRGILERAGYKDVVIEPVDDVLAVGGGGGVDEAVDFLLQAGPAATALRLAGGVSRDLVADGIREALKPFVTPDGVKMGAAAWLVTGA